RCRHREEVPRDVCLSVELTEGLASDAPIPRTVAVAVTNRLAYAKLRLFAQAPQNEALALETRAAELWSSIAEPDEAGSKRFRLSQLAWYASRIDQARGKLEENFADAHSLSSLAQDAGMSPFHFSRVFRELTGCPPHRYLVRVRLARAKRLLQEGW